MTNLERMTDLICTYPNGPFALDEKFKMAIRTVAIEADDKITELEKEIHECEKEIYWLKHKDDFYVRR